jgi:hypothetical protein
MGTNTEGVRKNKPKCRIIGVECQKAVFPKIKNPNTHFNIRLPYICHIIFYKKSLV